MARARNIKPSFFDNDVLAECEPLARLLFIGLWTIADHNGNLEWRSKRVKKQILAYDNCCIDSLAINLDKSGFVRFYSDGVKIYLNVVNFTKHQNPHKNERAKGTDIPDYSDSMRQVVDLNELMINLDLSGEKQDNSDTNPADSFNLIPDSLNQNPEDKDLFVEEKSTTNKKFNFSDDHYKFAEKMFEKILEVVPKTKKPNLEKWANDIRLINERDKIVLRELWNVFIWANNDGFWKTNILSPAKLREKFPQLEVKKNEASKPNGGQGTPSTAQPPLTEGQRLRIQLNQERAARGEPPIDWSSQ